MISRSSMYIELLKTAMFAEKKNMQHSARCDEATREIKVRNASDAAMRSKLKSTLDNLVARLR